MSRNEDVTTAIWEDLHELTPDAKLVYLWSFTNEHNNMSGLYKIRQTTIGFETGLPVDRVSDILAELERQQFVFYADGFLLVRTRARRLRSKSPQMAKSIVKDLQNVPADHPLRARFLEIYGSHPWLRDALAGTYREPIGNLSENPVNKGDSHTLSGTSPEVPGTGEGQGSSSEKIDLPSGFPRELRPHLRVAFRVLRDLAQRHHAKAVAPLSLAAVVMARPHKPIVRAAYDCAAHWDGRNQPVKDVVAAYRNWLERTDDLATFEQLGPNGLPGGNGSIRPAKENASSMLRDLWPDTPAEPIIDAEVIEGDAA